MTSLARTLKSVLWSFFGVRRASDHDRDLAGSHPLQLAVVAVGAALAFVLLLALLVRWVVSSGVAAG